MTKPYDDQAGGHRSPKVLASTGPMTVPSRLGHPSRQPKLVPHEHDLPRPSRWRGKGRVYACACGELFVCWWDADQFHGAWIWTVVGEP